MKWFKHQTDLARDEGVRLFMEHAGKDWMEAYGFLMFVLENIGEKMSAKLGDLHCSAAYSPKGWSNILGCRANRVNKYMPQLRVIPWVEVEFEGGIYKVTVERMYEWRDETTRKGKSTPERFAQRRTDKIRLDKREIDNDALSDNWLKSGSSKTPPTDFVVTEELRQWAMLNYPEVNIDEETAKFRNWEQPSPRNDWDAAWKLWIQRGSERMRNSKPTPDKANSIQALRKLGKDLNIVPKLGESDDEYLGRVERANEKRIDDLKL